MYVDLKGAKSELKLRRESGFDMLCLLACWSHVSVLEAAVEAEKELCCKDCLDRAAGLDLAGALISAAGYGYE